MGSVKRKREDGVEREAVRGVKKLQKTEEKKDKRAVS
jgi:hypothetical protein